MASPPDPYGHWLVQTVFYCHDFTAHSTTWTLDRPQHILDTTRPLEPTTWASVPLALRTTFPDASTHALRRKRMFTPEGSPVYGKVTGSQAAHCFWCYASAHTCRPIAWLLPVRAGLASAFAFGATRRACSASSCPPQGLTLWCRMATRSNCFLSLPSSPSEMDPRQQACLAAARETALWAGCP